MTNYTSPSANSIVSFRDVSKQYQKREAIYNLTFDLPTGTIVGLIGPNGSGKTTTLKLMSGLLHPSRGTVLLHGHPLTRVMAAKAISYLPDSGAVYPFYSVAQMVEYYKGLYQDFDAAKAIEMLEFMNLDPAQNVRTLSKGNLGRLKIALTVSRQVPLVVMDEPLSGLDPLVRQSIMKGLISFVDLNKQTVVLSTHEVDEVEPLLDIAILLAEGQIRAIASTDDIREQYGQSMVGWMKSVLDSTGRS